MRLVILPSSAPLQTLRLHVNSFLSRRHHPDAASFVRAFGQDDHYFGVEDGRVGAVGLGVKSERDQKRVEEVIAELDEKWRELLVVKVEK